MKNIISKSLPILFLVTALAFMMIFHHDDKLTDTEKADFVTLNSQDHTTNPREEIKEEEYTSTSDGEMVSVYDADDNQVSEIPQEQWEKNKDYYSDKFNLN